MKNFFNTLQIVLAFWIPIHAVGQELKANVVVNASLIPSTVEGQIFDNLERELFNLLNSRKWTDITFEEYEKIQCNFYVNLTGIESENTYRANLVIQAKRPIYGTDYFSTLINQTDSKFAFTYILNQFVEFNEFRVQGRDPLVANLTAVLAFYVYIILGINFETFDFKAGRPYFEKAFFIANNAPEKLGIIQGWEPTEPGRDNRFWIAENFVSANYNVMHDVFYDYYRKGMDLLAQSKKEAKQNIFTAIQQTYNVFNAYPGSVITRMFIQPRTDEILNIFSHSNQSIKSDLSSMLQKIDIAKQNSIIKTLGK